MQTRLGMLAAALVVAAACGGSGGGPEAAGPDAMRSADGAVPEPGREVGVADARREADGPSSDAGVAADATPPTADADSPRPDTAAPPAVDTLFVGNSYVAVNDVPSLYRTLAATVAPDVRVAAVTPGGYTLVQHAADARTEGRPLHDRLAEGFETVVLQEQSQIGGFPAPTRERTDSVAAALELAALAQARGARVVLYHTWGREHGDPTNALLGYGTYGGMQGALDLGYRGLASLLREQGFDVRLAPVGGAFRLVYEEVQAAGADPLAEGSAFDQLYEDDGSHPSPQGAWLAACVIAGTVTGADVRAFPDDEGLGAEVTSRLRAVCAAALADPRWHVPSIVRPETHLAGFGIQGEGFGAAVALAADGTRALVGAGSATRVFARTDAGWAEEALFPQGSEAVALDAGGSRALIGGGLVFARTGTDWAADGALPLSPWPGGAISLDAAGGRALVAEFGSDTGEALPVARSFTRGDDGWLDDGALLGRFHGWGHPGVALDASGTRAVVCEIPCRVFTRGDAGWAVEAVLPVDEGVAALSADGTRALIGRRDDDRAILFERRGSQWVEVHVFTGDPVTFFGASVALTGDGRRVFIGSATDAPGSYGESSGAVHVYDERENGWPETYLVAPDPIPTGFNLDHFGLSLAVSLDGTRAVVGAPHWDDADEQLYVGRASTFVVPAPAP